MTTTAKPPFKPAARENLAIACDNWRADATYPEIVDAFVCEMVFESADSEIGVMAMELARKVDMPYMDALVWLAEVGMVMAEREDPR